GSARADTSNKMYALGKWGKGARSAGPWTALGRRPASPSQCRKRRHRAITAFGEEPLEGDLVQVARDVDRAGYEGRVDARNRGTADVRLHAVPDGQYALAGHRR